MSEWISVKDRLPERPHIAFVRREWYLVALESGAVLTLAYEFDDERWHTVGSPVTHWMPLPEPPEKTCSDCEYHQWDKRDKPCCHCIDHSEFVPCEE